MKHLYILFLIPFFTINAQDITVRVDLSRLTYSGAGMNIYHSGSEHTTTDEGNGIFSYTFTGLSEGDVVEYQWLGYIDSSSSTSGATSLIPKILDGGIEENLRRKYSAAYTNESLHTDFFSFINYKVTALASDYTSPTHYFGSLERTNVTYSIITLNATSGGTYKAWNAEASWNHGVGTVDNGDDTYTLTLDPTTDSWEYYWKEEASDTSEDLTSCTGNIAIVNTDGSSYANRVHNAGESRTDTFNTCPAGTLSIIDNELGIIEIYPNPFVDRISVNTEEAIDVVRIYDLTGRMVQQTTPNKANFSLNVADLSKGVYLVKLNAGDKEATTKLIK